MNPAVSVIVLVYKVEKYIEQCARALFEQTLEDLEYVFVDDCTPDASMEILERVLEDYPARRERVKILHNEVNKGQAYSRRRGVEAATGDYIIHCDSDDWPEREMYERMYAKASKEALDIVICSLRRVFADHIEHIHEVTYTNDLIESLLFMDIPHYLHNKLIRRTTYDRLLVWPTNNICEDSSLIIQLATSCNRWGFVEEDLYNYRYVPESISSRVNTIEKVEQIRDNINLAISFLHSNGLEEKYVNAIRHLKCWVKTNAFSLSRRFYLHVYPECNLSFFFDRHFSARTRLGHLTKLLGIHGISNIFGHKK